MIREQVGPGFAPSRHGAGNDGGRALVKLAPAVALALIVLLGSLLRVALAQEGETLSLAEYRARLERIILQLSRTEKEHADQALQAARAELSQITGVRLPSGKLVRLRPLLSEADTLDEALDRLRLVQHQLAAAEGDDTAQRLALLETVLARREFAPLHQVPSLAERFLDWLGRLLERWAPESPESPVVNMFREVVFWTLLGIGAAFVALLLSFWLRGLLRSFVTDVQPREAHAAVPLTAAAARRQAMALAQAGSYRQAVRQLYLAALLALEESGLLRYDRSLTNREVLAQVAGITALQQHLQPVVETFEEVWYGVREPDRETFLRYQQEIEALMALAPRMRTLK